MTVTTTINGQTYTLTETSEGSGVFTATLTAPSASSYPETNHYFPVSVTATDEYGNSTTKDDTDASLGNSLKLFVEEKVKPVISISSPTSGAYITSSSTTLTFTIKDDTNQATGYSGVDQSTISVSASDGTVGTLTKTAVTGGYSVSVPITNMPDGSITLTIDGSDFDGNAANTATVTFTVDTVAPSLVLSSPTDDLHTNQQTIAVTGQTSDVTSTPVTVTISLDGTDQGTAVVGQDGSFTKNVTFSSSGAHTIAVTATDAAGKYTTVTRTVYYSSTAPVISSVSISPNPADAGATYVIEVTVS